LSVREGRRKAIMNVQAAAEGSTWIDVEGRIALEEKDIEEDNWQRKVK